jgi:hypothetical protein
MMGDSFLDLSRDIRSAIIAQTRALRILKPVAGGRLETGRVNRMVPLENLIADDYIASELSQ